MTRNAEGNRMPKKKSPAQLDREIAEASAERDREIAEALGRQRSFTTHERTAPSAAFVQKMANQLTLEELQRFTEWLGTDRGWQTIHLWFQKATNVRTARGK